MQAPKIRIVQKGICTHIFMDEKEVKGVKKLGFEQNPCELPILKMEVIATDMEIDGEMIPELPKIFEPYYVRKEADNARPKKTARHGKEQKISVRRFISDAQEKITKGRR